jgi:dienelactone hydrolase
LEVEMSFRRSAALVAAAVALLSGCKNVSQEAPAQELILAAFNSPVLPGSTQPALPTPNDLALQAIGDPAFPAGAQKALLQAFVVGGGFPSDQAVGITVPLKRLTFDAAANAYVVATPPLVDPTTVTTLGATPTVVVMKVDVPTPVTVTIEVDVENCTTGQLALKKAKGPTGSRAWAPGRYVFAVRGGANGVKTTTGRTVSPDQAIALVIPNASFANPDNLPIGFPAELAARVEAVRQALWLPLDWSNVGGYWTPAPSGSVTPAFTAVSAVIPPAEIASIGAFEVAPGASAIPNVPMPTAPVDSGSGIAPLPLDLLRTANSGTTIAFNAAFGPAAQGLTTLDGFSTTAMIFAPVTVPVDASTVNGSSVHLYKISGGTITRLKELKQELGIFAATGGASGDPLGAAYVAEPTPITTTQGNFVAPGVPCAAAGGCSLIVGLQPSVGAPVGPPFGTIYLPPLDEATDYAVFITTSVKDMLTRPLQKSTVAKILLDPDFDPVATSTVNGVSLLSGISNETATALRKMREQLVPVTAQLTTDTGKTAADVALAYTFRTQGGIKSTALGIVTLPYATPLGVSPDADAVTTLTPATAAAQYGIDPTVLTTLASIAELAEVKVQTMSWLIASQNSGAFDPANPTTETVTALVTIPDPTLVTGTCPTALPAYTAANCAPLVVFAHGLGSSKASVLPIAGALAARGFIVAAIDMDKHGDRSYCSGSGPGAQAAANAQCCPGGACGPTSTCAFKANLTTPVDAIVDPDPLVPPIPIQIGFCESAPGVRGGYLNYRLDCDGINPDGTPNLACFSSGGKGTAYASANRLISLNFFRVRDTLRQDVIDKSALVKALAPIGKSADAFAAYLEATHGLAVDFTKVYFVGHSGGVFSATASLAVNPRFTRAVTYAGGATAIDVFANPESRYHANLVALLAGADVTEGSADYLKLLQIGKWIMDPADPANFAKHVIPGSLPSPFALPPFSATPLAALWPAQPVRDVLTQLSICDGTVPNAQNQLFSALLGLSVPSPSSATTGRVQWYAQTGAGVCPGDAVTHSNLLDFVTPSLTQQAQAYASDFLASPANVVTPVLPLP